MNEFDQQKMQTRYPINLLDALCQEFGGLSFYGLEYIIEDIFQPSKAKPANFAFKSVDWFGLYD